MELYVGITDEKWFEFLKDLRPDEVNFWRPLAKTDFKAIATGQPFLFKLHSPHDFIVGGGFLVSYSRVPLSVAWEAFGMKNGSPDLQTFQSDIHRYREKRGLPFEANPPIGCIILSNPFFFEEYDWIPAPLDWSPNIVQGKTYKTVDQIGADLWKQVQIRLGEGTGSHSVRARGISEEGARYGAEYLARPRIGQGAFRILVTEAYARRCAITGERTLPVLQASHIKPYAQSGPHSVNNGLLVRADLHILFDRGYITIDTDFKVNVSGRIQEEFENGRDYYRYHGKSLVVLPNAEKDRPSAEFIEWHNRNVFVT